VSAAEERPHPAPAWYTSGVANDRLRAALAALRRHRDPAVKARADEFAALAAEALEQITAAAQKAHPDFDRNRVRIARLAEVNAARLAEAHARRAARKSPSSSTTPTPNGGSTP
jgi:hypothetical protein